jgi:hypothetical protein
MASISNHRKGCRTIQFIAADGKRRSIRLGKMPKRLAEEIKVRVEVLANAQRSSLAPDGETATWLTKIGDDLADKLAGVGLIEPRHAARLGDFLDRYIAGRTGIKRLTRRNLQAARQKLVDYFGEDKPLRTITAGDADDWKEWLQDRYASATIGRAIKFGKQFFRYAKREHLILENPFEDMTAPAQVNESRKFFVNRADTQGVLEACPTPNGGSSSPCPAMAASVAHLKHLRCFGKT